MDLSENVEVKSETFGCTNCGADLNYKPGTKSLVCDYCSTQNEIPQLDLKVQELDFHQYLDSKSIIENTYYNKYVKCSSCGASSSIDAKISSSNCPYCSTPLIVEDSNDDKLIQPNSLLPFKLAKKEAKSEVKKWINKLWFAPSDLQKAVLNFDHFKGVYMPYWTFDLDTLTNYVGQRGEYYYETVSYTATENGRTVTKYKKVQKIRWFFVNGSVAHFFDDILISASNSLPKKYVSKLEPWDLKNLIPFDKSYLSGFVSEKYQVDLEEGFDIAKSDSNQEIRSLVRRNIGGDRQRIISLNTNYKDISFKHLLLPVYVSAFRYKNKLYRFLVNGRTGEVQGERPYSWIKISLTILIGLILLGGLYLYFELNK